MTKLNTYKIDFLNRNKVHFVLVIALIVRLIVALNAYVDQVWLGFGDDAARLNFAKSIIQNGFVPKLTNFYATETIFAPIIPIIIAVKILVFGDSWLPIFILNSIISTFTCYIIYLIACKFFDEKVSLLAMIWAALYPNFLRYIGTAGNEIWLVFLFTVTFLFAVKAINENGKLFTVVLFGLFFVLLFHTDERYISYTPFFALILLLGTSTVWVKIKKVIVFSVMIILLSIPWLIRNYLVYDDIVLISIRTTNLTSRIFNHRKELIAFDHEPKNTYFTPRQIDSVRKGVLTVFPNTGEPISNIQLKAMKEGNVPHQFDTQEKILSRTYFLWIPFKFHDNWRIDGFAFNPAWSLRHNLASIFGYAILLPFAFISIILLWKNRNYLVLFLFSSILLYHTFIHVAFIPYTRDRYRHSIDFIIIIAGLYGMQYVYNKINRNRLKRTIKTDKSQDV